MVDIVVYGFVLDSTGLLNCKILSGLDQSLNGEYGPFSPRV
jgi:hypothetical protein